MSCSRLPLAVLVALTGYLSTATTALADVPGATARGAIPAAFPARMLVGIGSDTPNDTYAKNSGTKWDVQWVYLTGQHGNNWYNGFGGAPSDGSWIDGFFSTIDSNGFIPGIHLYNIGYGHDQGGDTAILTQVQDQTWTKNYFTEWKALMTRAKAFNKPVVIVLEGDSFGFLENLTQNDPSKPAAVASTGIPELANLPNTVAGFGQAYLAIRKNVGAYNVAFGPDTPYYAAQGDIMNFDTTSALQPHVDYQWTFFGPIGGGANVTGDTFDFLASCPDDADCASYTDGRPCWDPSDGASITTASINRYAEWLRLMNQKSGIRWMLHQVPLGNSQHLNVPFNGSPRSGYKDNRAEYLFQVESPATVAIRDQHLAKFANAGVMGMLFGFSNDNDSPSTDLWKDNKPFLATHVALLNNDGGIPIARGDGANDGGVVGPEGGTTSSSSGSSGGTTSSGGTSSGGTTSSGGPSSGGASSGGASSGGTDAGPNAAAPSGDDSGGCGCSTSETSGTGAAGMVLLLASSIVLSRSRRRR